MADLFQVSADQLSTDNNAEPNNLDLISSPTLIPEDCEYISFHSSEIGQDNEQVESDEKTDSAEEKTEVNVLEDIIQLIELVNTCSTIDGTAGKNKYKDGFCFLENLQTQFENIQEQVTEKDKLIVELVIENGTLKCEANTSKEKLNEKCQQLEELQQNYNKLQETINSKKISEKNLPPSPISLDNLNLKANKLKLRFTQLKLQIEKQVTTQNDLSSTQRNITIKTFQDNVETSLCKLEYTMSLLAKCKKDIVKQMEYIESTLQKLNDRCAETVTCTVENAETQSTPPPQQYSNLVRTTSTNFPGKPKSPVDSLPQSRPTSFSGFNLTNVSVPSLPHVKPFTAGLQNTNNGSHQYPKQYKNPSDQIHRPPISRNYPNFPLPQQQQIYNGNSNTPQNTPVIQQYPNLISQAQNKCSTCGMTFFTPEQLKLHDDLVQ